LTKHGQYAFLLDVDKVRGIESIDSPDEIAEKVRQASKQTHDIIRIVLAKKPDGSLPGGKSKFSQSMDHHLHDESGSANRIFEKEEKTIEAKEPFLSLPKGNGNDNINH